jgi:hypothetical protein
MDVIIPIVDLVLVDLRIVVVKIKYIIMGKWEIIITDIDLKWGVIIGPFDLILVILIF